MINQSLTKIKDVNHSVSPARGGSHRVLNIRLESTRNVLHRVTNISGCLTLGEKHFYTINIKLDFFGDISYIGEYGSTKKKKNKIKKE